MEMTGKTNLKSLSQKDLAKWAALGLWAQNHHQIVGICPGHGPQLVAQNQPPPLT